MSAKRGEEADRSTWVATSPTGEHRVLTDADLLHAAMLWASLGFPHDIAQVAQDWHLGRAIREAERVMALQGQASVVRSEDVR